MPHLSDPSIRKYCYAIQVYDGYKQGYWAFLIPEASLSIDKFFEWRELRGERLTQESPIFSTIGKTNTKFDYLTDGNARVLLFNLIRISGLKRVKIGKARYDKSIMYMFRKRFNTILKINNDVNSNIAEKLMAHKKGLDGTYLQPTREECHLEFLKAVSALTIDSTQRQSYMIEEQKNEINELNKERNENDKLRVLLEDEKMLGYPLKMKQSRY